MCTIGRLVTNTSLSAQRALQEQPLIYTFLSNHCSQQLTKDTLLSITINMNDQSSVLRKWHVHQSFIFTFIIFNTKLVNYFSKQVANKVDMSPLYITQHMLTPTTDWPAMTVLMHSYSRDMADVLKNTTAIFMQMPRPCSPCNTDTYRKHGFQSDSQDPNLDVRGNQL